jgi:hypothetical protein
MTDGSEATRSTPESATRSLRDLQERAKELTCLYAVEDVVGNPDLSEDGVLTGVIAVLPAGWQYPDVCAARIRYLDRVHASARFVETPWTLHAPIRVQGEQLGAIDVCYLEERPPSDEGPFLKEERKLLEAVVDRLEHHFIHRRLLEVMEAARAAGVTPSRPGWRVMLDLLERTEPNLLMRIGRKMINHLRLQGVTEADLLLHRFTPPGGEDQDPRIESNQPADKEDLPSPTVLIDEAFRLAATHLRDSEIVERVDQWIRQDRAAFLAEALENEATSLAEVQRAVDRYLHATRGEVELPAPVMKGLRVSLVRRILTDQLEYINIAKGYLDVGDFNEVLERTIYPPLGHGKLGGKAAGLLLAKSILGRQGEQFADVKTPRTWYITSDVLHQFIRDNHLEDVVVHKYKEIEEIRHEYPDIVQVFKHARFSPDIVKSLAMALDEFGDRPLIVRSSSLLEDRVGAAFSGKYKSLFVANQGTKQERLAALLDAVSEVYASVFAPDPIEYRTERNLIDFREGMGVLVQEVVGRRIGPYFLPLVAGVGFSHNEFRWSPRIRREDGLLRIVPGIGTRAVDRVGDDYPVLVSPGRPELRANTSPDEIMRYSPRYLDVINLDTNRFETVGLKEFLSTAGNDLPGAEQLLSIYEQGRLRRPMRLEIDYERDDLVVTLDGWLAGTQLVREIGDIMALLRREIGTPIDIEFAHDGDHLYLLQCRAQSAGPNALPAPIPRDVARSRVLFTARRFVSNGTVPGLTHLVYVDPARYAAVERHQDLTAIGQVVSRLNKLLPKRRFALLGPGRWGSRGDIKLGVRVTYSDINNTALLIEIARRAGGYTPDVSFGTHFFQDLVEASIRYLPLYPDEPEIIFNESFFTGSENVLRHLVPEAVHLEDIIRVIDVPRATDGQVVRVLMNADLDEALAIFTAPDEHVESPEATEPLAEAPQHQFWRWRMRMAERMAERIDSARYGVVALYVFGSTENGTAGAGSDIDLLVHVRGTAQELESLDRWFDGWSQALAEINYLRTGYSCAGLLDVHYITDEDIAARTSYAVKIGAVTDAARPLRLKSAPAPGAAGSSG